MPRTLAACLALAGWLWASAASAADIKVLTAGAFRPVIAALVPGFERQTGNRVTVENDTAGALLRRIAAGEAFDVVVLTPEAIAPLRDVGKIAPGSPTRLARVGIGVAVRDGAEAPHIATVQAFKDALLAARAVAYIDPASGGSSGAYLVRLFERLGIADRIEPKAVLVPGGLVATRVVSGEADIALHQISEILAVPGAKLVGPIPAEIQSYTTYEGAISVTSRDEAASRAFLRALSGGDAAAVLREKGMEPPPASGDR